MAQERTEQMEGQELRVVRHTKCGVAYIDSPYEGCICESREPCDTEELAVSPHGDAERVELEKVKPALDYLIAVADTGRCPDERCRAAMDAPHGPYCFVRDAEVALDAALSTREQEGEDG